MNLFSFLALFITTTIASAAELTFSLATPQLKVGQQLTISVSGATGTVTWGALTGKIEGQGMEASYVPIQLGTDLITVLDELGHFSSLKVKVLPAYSVENANFEVFTNRDYIKHLAYSVSADGTRETLWAATEGGLEERDLKTGKVNIYRKSDGLPSTDVTALAFDSQKNLWVGTGDGLAKRSADGHWETIVDLPSNMIQSLQVDENDTVWIATFMGGLVSLSTTGQREVFNKTQIPEFPSNDIYRVVAGELGIYVVFLDGNIGSRRKGDNSWAVSNFSSSKDEAVMKQGIDVI